MICDQCRNEGPDVTSYPWHAGRKVRSSSSQTTNLLAQQVTTTVSQYSDIVPFDVHICGACLKEFSRTRTREIWKEFLKLVPGPAAVGIVGFSLPQGPSYMGFVRIVSFLALGVALIGLIFFLVQILASRAYEMGRPLADRRAREMGRDTTWTPKQHSKLRKG